MRNVHAVYTKLRDVKYVHLVKLYKKLLKRTPENCKYNYKYLISGKAPIFLCLLHQPKIDLENGIFPHLIDICQDMQQCKNCNAFIPRYNKKEIQELFRQRLNNKKLKEREYTDLCALEWVLEKSVLGIPPLGIIQKLIFTIKKWLSKNKVL